MVWLIIGSAAVVLLVLLVVLRGFFLISQAQAAVIERLGKFNRVVYSGLNFK